MSKNPLISVVMNCYNSGKYLREAIESVRAQTYQNWEIIFWDNQSTDDSAAIFKSYDDLRLKYFFAPEHTTLGEARNQAIAQVHGEWVGFLDCDDLWLPQKLDKQVAIIHEEGQDLGLVYGHMRVMMDENQNLSSWAQRMSTHQKKAKLAQLPEGLIFEKLLLQNFVPLLSALVRRSALHQVGRINPHYKQAEDYDLFLKVAKEFKARAVQEVVAVYRVHGANATQTQQTIGFGETMHIMRNYLPLKAAQKAIRVHCAHELIRRVRSKQGLQLSELMEKSGGAFYLYSTLSKMLLRRCFSQICSPWNQ